MIISLIFLLLMTLIGTAAMRSATMQEQMAGNTRDWNLAFQAAEAALRDAEDYLQTTFPLPEFDDADGLYQVNSPSTPVWAGGAVSDGNGSIQSVAIEGVAERPRYFIEELIITSETETGTQMEDTSYFRVTAVGYGAAIDADDNPVASVVLSTVYRNR